MLRINHDGRDVQVRFDYGTVCQKKHLYINDFAEQFSSEEERRYTDVRIIFPDNNAEFQGRAICHPADNFCKSTGRKLALANAMVDFDRSLRKSIWQEYHRHCK